MKRGRSSSKRIAPELPIEEKRSLSKSVLWRLQRRFFEASGTAAWSSHTVPHYITSNAFIAYAYAKVVFGWMRDAHRLGWIGSKEPLHILELGAGSGRFGFLFLQQFLELHQKSLLKDIPVRYVLSDFAERNVAAFAGHPSLRPLFDASVLDVARVDLESDEETVMLRRAGPLSRAPLVVLANYVFDSLPQDAFSVREGQLLEDLVTVWSRERDPGRPDLVGSVRLTFDAQPARPDHYGDAELDAILVGYRQRLGSASFSFPNVAIRALRRLERLAGGRLLVLSADKGQVHEDALRDGTPPRPASHGSISLMVNYHAIGEWARARGGQVLATSHRHASLGVCAFALGGQCFVETAQAFEDAVERGGPDDFLTLKRSIEARVGQAPLPEVLALLRMGRWDPRLLWICIPAIDAAADQMSEMAKREVSMAIERAWRLYFPIGEERDLPFALGVLLGRMRGYQKALRFFTASLRQNGADPATLVNMARCHFQLGELDEARRFVGFALDLAPGLSTAEGLRAAMDRLDARGVQ
jgi:tetratricopeptide (TPR) repeat protein